MRTFQTRSGEGRFAFRSGIPGGTAACRVSAGRALPYGNAGIRWRTLERPAPGKTRFADPPEYDL